MFPLIFHLILLCAVNFTKQQPCSRQLSVDISNGTSTDNGLVFGRYTFDEENYYIENAVTFGCICNIANCIRKCCMIDDILQNNTCVENPYRNFSISIYEETTVIPEISLDDFYVVTGVQCPPGSLGIAPDSSSDLFLQQNGSLFVQSFDTVYSVENYCIDIVDDEISAWLCEYIDEGMSELQKEIYMHGMIISMPFLALTFLVYLVLPEKNLHRKALMFYVLSLLLGYIFLVSVQLHEGQVSNGVCHLVGYCIIFFFLVSFFWMNVMCVDMFLAFSGVRGYNDKRNAERRRFIYYCVYAWGTPVLHIILVFLLNTYGDKQAIYHPLLGEKKCFLEDGYPNLFYFYLPMGILTGINIILFILTAVRIQKVKRETSVLKHSDSKRHSYEDDKQKFNLYLKLLFAMGINWTMEIISWAFLWKLKEVPTSVWYLTDFANALYGVFIFFIFVFKKKIWKSLKKRYYVFIGKPHLAHTMTTSTQSTRTSHFSTTDSGVNNDYRLNEVRNYRGEDRALNVN